MATARKNVPEVIENDVTAAEKEAVAETTEKFTFTVTVGGKERELVDVWPQSKKPPAELALMGNEQMAARLFPGLLKKIIGEDILFELIDQNIDVVEVQGIVRAWVEARGLKN